MSFKFSLLEYSTLKMLLELYFSNFRTICKLALFPIKTKKKVTLLHKKNVQYRIGPIKKVTKKVYEKIF